MRPGLFWEVLRPREKLALLVGVLLFVGLLARSWITVGRGSTSAGSERVAAELARRAEAGDPVPIEAREWGPAKEGARWSELDSDPHPANALLLDPDALAACRAGHAARVAEHGAGVLTPESFAACALWSASRAELPRLLEDDEFLRRDPALWAAAGSEQRRFRAVRAFVMSDDRGDESPCRLGRPSGRDRLAATRSSEDFEVFEDRDGGLVPHIDWMVGQAEPRFAALEWAALTGSVTDARRALEDLVCLRDTVGSPVLTEEFFPRFEMTDLLLRETEACVPLLGPAGADLLAEAARACDDESNRVTLRRVLRGERATVYDQYLELRELEIEIEGLGSFRDAVYDEEGFFVEDGAVNSFLTYLRDSDAALAALELLFEDASTELARLERDRRARETRGYFSSVVFPLGDSLLGAATTADANQACALVAGVAAEQGADAARELAARTPDPFDGEPLRTRVRDDGVFEVWSVGTDLVDDDGHSARERGSYDLDVVFRVPLPKP